MRKHSKLILASLTATLLMALAVSGTASARVFSVDNMNFRVVWTSLEFRAGELATIRCRVTLEGSFHSQTISKVEKALIGYVSRAIVAGERCTGGSATVHAESLPWHITYSGFTGTLPNIRSIRVLLQNGRFQIRDINTGVRCTGIIEPNHQARGEIRLTAEGQADTLTPDGSVNIPLEGLFCPANGQFTSPAGDGRITLLGTTTRIMVTLI
jgi:hypothetical protein